MAFSAEALRKQLGKVRDGARGAGRGSARRYGGPRLGRAKGEGGAAETKRFCLGFCLPLPVQVQRPDRRGSDGCQQGAPELLLLHEHLQ